MCLLCASCVGPIFFVVSPCPVLCVEAVQLAAPGPTLARVHVACAPCVSFPVPVPPAPLVLRCNFVCLPLSCRCLCTGMPSPREDVLDAAVARAAAKRRKPKPEFAWGGTNPFDSQYAKPS